MKCGKWILVSAAWLAVALPGVADAKGWRTYKDVEFDNQQGFDGDSFHLKVPSGEKIFDWVIRLYGVDCPETDNRFPERNAEQAKHFGIDVEDVPGWGKKAARRTRDLLRGAKEIRLHVRDPKEKTRKAKGREQRYYGIVEMIDKDGKSTFLHEELLKEGLARAFGMAAPWPPKDAGRHGEEKTEERFERELKRLEHKAKQDKKGIWGG